MLKCENCGRIIIEDDDGIVLSSPFCAKCGVVEGDIDQSTRNLIAHVRFIASLIEDEQERISLLTKADALELVQDLID